MGSIEENIRLIQQRVNKVAQSVGRDPQNIKLVVAIKTQKLESIYEAIEAGITDVADNRVQEASSHSELIKQKYPQVTIHMIGHLQRNKVKPALELFDVIQSVDSERLAQAIADKAKQPVSVLIEVNTSMEENKYGVPIDKVADLVKKVSSFPQLKIQGLMTMAPFVDNEEIVRSCFKGLKDLSEEIKLLNLPNVSMEILSMGMTDDFEIAIQEGSSLIRIGRAIFGERGRL